MKTTVYSQDLVDMIMEGRSPGFFYDNAGEISERSYSAELFVGKGHYNELFFEGVHIGYGNVALRNDTLLHFENEVERVEMHFALSGTTMTNAGPFQDFSLGGNQHNIMYANGLEGKSELESAQEIRTFEVNLLPSFFRKYLPEESKVFRSFASNLENKRSGPLMNHHCRISTQMHQIINQIISCQRTGRFKRMFVESKIIELLMLQLEQMGADEGKALYSLKKPDIEKMYAARELVLDNIAQPLSLRQLVKQVGTNECTLRKGFKEIFGTTVFGLLSEAKMEQAKVMLLDQGLTVSEVSELVGYKHPQHFSAAFKRHYGFSPRALKS
ncbi:MAG: helix-turn-helix transcriptional regulator [Cyclobacteriaceae bacterium]